MGGARRLLSGQRSSSTERGANLLQLRYEGWSLRGEGFCTWTNNPAMRYAGYDSLHGSACGRSRANRATWWLARLPAVSVARWYASRGYPMHDSVRRPSCALVDERTIHLRVPYQPKCANFVCTSVESSDGFAFPSRRILAILTRFRVKSRGSTCSLRGTSEWLVPGTGNLGRRRFCEGSYSLCRAHPLPFSDVSSSINQR